MQVFFGSHLPLLIAFKSCFVTTTRLSFLACQKDAAAAVLKKVAPALGYGQQKYRLRLRLHPKSGGSRRLRLCNTALPSFLDLKPDKKLQIRQNNAEPSRIRIRNNFLGLLGSMTAADLFLPSKKKLLYNWMSKLIHYIRADWIFLDNVHFVQILFGNV